MSADVKGWISVLLLLVVIVVSGIALGGWLGFVGAIAWRVSRWFL